VGRTPEESTPRAWPRCGNMIKVAPADRLQDGRPGNGIGTAGGAAERQRTRGEEVALNSSLAKAWGAGRLATRSCGGATWWTSPP